ncbi:MAG TPA: CrcB family protein [Polyangiaceae bacterium]|nr:CrcB family protein [Polyangiaceae bacterium]
MIQVLLIGLGGAIGTLVRYGVGLWAAKALGTGFPYATLIVNIAGCFFITLVAHTALVTTLISPTMRLTLMTGFMGGLTTYSSFDFETTNLLRQGSWWLAGVNVAVTLVLCFAAGLAGLGLAKKMFGG